MRYNKFFSQLLLEQDLPMGDSRVHDAPPDDLGGFLDKDTDPDELMTQGLKDTFDAVQQRFNSKMTEFADTLSPEAVKTLPLGELREKIGEVYKFVNRIQIYSKGKIEQISEDPYAIMAAFLAGEPTKMAAFEDLHGNLDDFQSAVQEIESQLASLKGQIDDFVSDVEDIDAESAANDMSMSSQPSQPLPQGGMSRGSPPQGSGMRYNESRQRRRKHRRPIKG